MKGFLLGEGTISSATVNLVKEMQSGFFSTKEKLGWNDTLVNLKTQGECLQIETNKFYGRGVLLMVQKSVSLFCILYEEQNKNMLDREWLCLFLGGGRSQRGYLSPLYEFSLFKLFFWKPFIINNNKISNNILAWQHFT